MKRRCWFLDNLPAYNYNTGAGIRMEGGDVTDTKTLGSTLITAMIREARQFCHPCFNDNRDYHQVLSETYYRKKSHVVPRTCNGHSYCPWFFAVICEQLLCDPGHSKFQFLIFIVVAALGMH